MLALIQQLLPSAYYCSYAAPLIAEAVQEDIPELQNIQVVLLNGFPKLEFEEPQPRHENVLKLVWFSQYIAAGRGLEKIIAGYVGNLRMEALDRKTMVQVIEQNPEVHFIFWGAYTKNDLNLGGIMNEEVDLFIHFLESKDNVELRGVVSTDRLKEEMKEADLFWLCWNIGVNSLCDGSNSHKILEYLSTGKPVVAHHVSNYAGTNLLYMLNEKENTGYKELFRNTIELVKKGEEREIIRNRLARVSEKSYTKQLVKIERLINENRILLKNK